MARNPSALTLAWRHPYGLSLFVQLVLSPLLIHDWDGFVFRRAVHDFLASGATPYAVAEMDPGYIHLSNAWPPLNTWYAYPPLAFLLMLPATSAALATGASSWVVRAALKAPGIAGTLMLAWIGAKLLRRWGKKTEAATWERLILFNPFLLFVAAGWGMFDAWMIALLLLSVLFLDCGRIAWAGAAFGAAALVKLFPLFAAPAFVLYVFRRRSPERGRDAARFTAAAAAVFAAVSLPFFIPHPRGFLLQVLLMHLRRPPQGLSLPAFAGECMRLASASGWIEREPSLAAVGALCLGVTFGVTTLTTVAASRSRTGAAFTRALLGLFLGVLYASKVLNEQYFVIPVALYAFVACSSGARWARAGYVATTAGASVASLLLGWHFLTFFPPDVAARLFGRQPDVIIGRIAAASGLGAAAFAFAPTLASFVALIPAFVIGVRTTVPECRRAARVIAVALAAKVRGHRPKALTVALALLIVPPCVQALALAADRRPTPPPLDRSGSHVAAFYYLWWQNPSHDPGKADGNWRGSVTERPADGYYSVTAAKVRKDFKLARASGIDVMVTSFHEYDVPLLPAVLGAAYEQDVAVAPLIELSDIYMRPPYGSPDGGFTISEQTSRAIIEMTSKALTYFARSPAAYRLNGKPVVFVYDAYYSGGDWSPAFAKQLVDRAVAIAAEDSKEPGFPAVTRADLEDAFRDNFRYSLNDLRFGYLLRRAYSTLESDFWRGVRDELERRFGPLVLVSGETWNPGFSFRRGAQAAIDDLHVFDATFLYSLSFVWISHKEESYERNWQRWAVRSTLQAQYARGADRPLIATVMPSYDDRVLRKAGFAIPALGPRGGTYDLTWKLASESRPDLVLVSTWNEFFEGSAVEPTAQHHDAFLTATRAWSARLSEAPQKRKHGLVLTSEASAHYALGVADPSSDEHYARNLQVLAERNLGDYAFDAIDVESPILQSKDLSEYALVLAEPSPRARASAITALLPRLQAWVHAGGRLFVSGAPAGTAWEGLVHAHAKAGERGATRAVSPDGAEVLALPSNTRPLVEELDDGTKVGFRFVDGDAAAHPATWSLTEGAGRIAAAALNVSGRDLYPGADATALFCTAVRPALELTDRCENMHPDVVP